MLGPLGLFAHNWVHGKDVVVRTDQVIPIQVAQTVHVHAQGEGLQHGRLRALDDECRARRRISGGASCNQK